MHFIHTIVDILLQSLYAWGYTGIVVLMALESSLLPVPSELVMIPAGYLAAQGKMSVLLLILAGAFGSVIGALFNYFCALYFGRALFLRFGKYVGIGEHHLERVEQFFYRHGEMSTFVGRLLPVIRHLISIPAGFARMSLWRLIFFTFVGSGLWSVVLVSIGYFAGADPRLQKDLLTTSSTYVVLMVLLLIGAYIIYDRKNPRNVHRLSVSEEVLSVAQSGKRVAVLSQHESIKRKDTIYIVTDSGKEKAMAIVRAHEVKNQHQIEVFLQKELVDKQVLRSLLGKEEEYTEKSTIYLLAPINKKPQK